MSVLPRVVCAFFVLSAFACLFAPVIGGPTCLPGQQPCVNTCCDTAQNYTCCPYNGGYCAPPSSFCCETGPKGLCDKGDTCCPGGCATSDQECCYDSICTDGLCCSGSLDSESFCRNASAQCCTGGNDTLTIDPTVYPCDKGSTCCSGLTSRQCNNNDVLGPQDALNACCASGTVCCPPAQEVNSAFVLAMRGKLPVSRLRKFQPQQERESTACGPISSNANPFETTLERLPRHPEARPLDATVTPCADPTTDFCCGGMACPTETLCCSGDGSEYADGCCFGFDSKTYSCDDFSNSTCPG